MSSLEKIVSFEGAFALIQQQARECVPSSSEFVSLEESAGRILAESIDADRDLPPFPRSTRDGFAVRSADLSSLPAKLQIVGEIKAGDASSPIRLSAGEAVSIMTGAAVPSGADAVVMVEHVQRIGDAVEIAKAVAPGENFVPAGAEALRGNVLVTAGSRIDHSTIALAASVGKTRLKVFARPNVAILATGDELVDVAELPGATQIRNSNSHSLAAQVRAAGGIPAVLPIAPDEEKRLRRLIEQGLESNLLLLSGGVSMGKYDLVEQVLREFEAEFFFTGALIQPGKPVVFGKARRKYFFGLPGNPVSTMVTFALFVRPFVQALSGSSADQPAFLRARLKKKITTKTGLKRFLPGLLQGAFENSEVELLSWQGSGDLAAIARANCFVVIPADREEIPAGDWVSVLPR